MNEPKNDACSHQHTEINNERICSKGHTRRITCTSSKLQKAPFFKYVVTFVELVIDLTIYRPIRDRKNQYMIVLSGSGQLKIKRLTKNQINTSNIPTNLFGTTH